MDSKIFQLLYFYFLINFCNCHWLQYYEQPKKAKPQRAQPQLDSHYTRKKDREKKEVISLLSYELIRLSYAKSQESIGSYCPELKYKKNELLCRHASKILKNLLGYRNPFKREKCRENEPESFKRSAGLPRAVILMAAKPSPPVAWATASILSMKMSRFLSQLCSPS